MEPKRGEIKSFSEENCPYCNCKAASPISAFIVDKIWDGRKWVVLESYEGGWLSRRLAGGVLDEPSNAL